MLLDIDTKNTILIERSSKNVKIPERSYIDSAGRDIYTNESFALEPKSEKNVGTGLKLYLPKNRCALILPRSGYRSVKVAPKLLDPGYTGNY